MGRNKMALQRLKEAAEKAGYPHFMLKEIYEQPDTLRNTLRLQNQFLDLMTEFLDRAGEVFLVACGTSYHACLAASYMFSKLAFLATQEPRGFLASLALPVSLVFREPR
jgi:glucosamine 6-phosphate synthetase-like amidotransferase/phosphosugar isomerase protein